MSLDVGSFLLNSVPFARHLGIIFDKAADGVAVCRLPDNSELRNHVGGPHAGALFTLAESASGAAMLSALSHELSRAVPLTTGAEVRYRKLALGEVVAEGRLLGDRTSVAERLDAGERPEFDVAVAVRNTDGVVVSEMTFHWTLRPN